MITGHIMYHSIVDHVMLCYIEGSAYHYGGARSVKALEAWARGGWRLGPPEVMPRNRHWLRRAGICMLLFNCKEQTAEDNNNNNNL